MPDNILLTGASGFLGQEIYSELYKHKSLITTIGRSKGNAIISDISNDLQDFTKFEFTYVIHAAGKAHSVPRNQEEENEFFRVNVNGTTNLLKALNQSNQRLRSFIFISSVSVYGIDDGEMIPESAPLLATDAYGRSKIEAEKLVIDWCSEKKVPFYILRLPLIAGSNPPGNLGAMIKGIQTGRYLRIGNAGARKSVVLAKDVAGLCYSINGKGGIYNLTDGYHPSFKELEALIAKQSGKIAPLSIPLSVAKVLGWIGDILGEKFPVDSRKIRKITSTLTFSDDKARTQLNWKPRPVLDNWLIN